MWIIHLSEHFYNFLRTKGLDNWGSIVLCRWLLYLSHAFWVAGKLHVCSKKDVIYYPKNISAVKKGEAKKVQVTEQPKDVISLWGQEEKLH